jgi:PleD family two-component response regulator
MLYTISKDNAGAMGLPATDKADIICGRQSRKGAILVANDDKQICKQLAAILDKIGYDFVVSTNGEQALALFLKKSFDIVFTALKMPGMDGLTLSLQVKATSLNTPVVLILDENIENIMDRVKAGRIDCVISKPLRSGGVQKTMQYFLGAGRYGKRTV